VGAAESRSAHPGRSIRAAWRGSRAPRRFPRRARCATKGRPSNVRPKGAGPHPRTSGRNRATARQGQTDGAAHESQRAQPIGVGRRAVRVSRYWGTAFEARPSSRVRRLRRRPAPIVVPDCAPQPRARSWPPQTPDTTRARSRPRCHPSTSERPVVVKGWKPPQRESSSSHLNRNRLGPRHRRAHRRHPEEPPHQHDQSGARGVEAGAPRVLPAAWQALARPPRPTPLGCASSTATAPAQACQTRCDWLGPPRC
jgi:hypothetical protein